MKLFTVEAPPLSLGVILACIYREYPDLKISHQWGINNVQMHPITKQPFQTGVMYMTYTLKDKDAEIDQNKIMALVNPTASAPSFKANLKN